MAAVSLAEMPLPQAPTGPPSTSKPQAPSASASTPRTLAQPISLASPLVETTTESYTFPTAAAAIRAPLDPEAMLQFFTSMISAHHRRELELERQYNDKLEAVNNRAKEQAEWAKTAEAWSQERAEENRRRKEELLQREHAVLALERQVRQREALCIEREKVMMQMAARHGSAPEVGQPFPPGPVPQPLLPGAVNEGPTSHGGSPPQQAMMIPVAMPQQAQGAPKPVEAVATRPTSPSTAPRRGRPSKSAKAKAVEAAAKAAKEAEASATAASTPSVPVKAPLPAAIATRPTLAAPSPPRGSKRKQPGVTPLCLPPQPAPRPAPRKRISKLALDVPGAAPASGAAPATTVLVEQGVTLTASPQSSPETSCPDEQAVAAIVAPPEDPSGHIAGPPKKKTKRQLAVEVEKAERQRRRRAPVKGDEAAVGDKAGVQPKPTEVLTTPDQSRDASVCPPSSSSSGAETEVSLDATAGPSSEGETAIEAA